MYEVIKDNKLFFTILKLLESIGEIECVAIDGATIAIKKEQIVFCLIINTDIYLRADDKQAEHFMAEEYIYAGNKYKKLGRNYLNNHDIFLQIATKSYWLARGLEINGSGDMENIKKKVGTGRG